MFDTVIFDLDGTLLDTLKDLYLSTNEILKKYSLPTRTIDEIRMFVGNGVPKLIERAIPKEHKHLFDDILADFKEYYKEHSSINTRPYDGIISLLEHLKADGYKIGVVSNKLDFATKDLCNQYFGDLIDIAIGERENIQKKPCPDSVFEVMRVLESCSSVYVGDSDVDIMTAKNANIPCISVTWGFRSREFLKENGGYIFADNTKELEKIIKTGEII